MFRFDTDEWMRKTWQINEWLNQLMNEARNESMNKSFHLLLENSHLFLEAKHRPPPTLFCPRRKDKVLVTFAYFFGRFCPALSPLHWPNLSGTECESLHALSGWGETLTQFLFIVQRDFPSHHSWWQSQIDDD